MTTYALYKYDDGNLNLFCFSSPEERTNFVNSKQKNQNTTRKSMYHNHKQITIDCDPTNIKAIRAAIEETRANELAEIEAQRIEAERWHQEQIAKYLAKLNKIAEQSNWQQEGF